MRYLWRPLGVVTINPPPGVVIVTVTARLIAFVPSTARRIISDRVWARSRSLFVRLGGTGIDIAKP